MPFGLVAEPNGSNVDVAVQGASSFTIQNCAVSGGGCSDPWGTALSSTQVGSQIVWPSASPGLPFWTDLTNGDVYSTTGVGGSNKLVASGFGSPTNLATDGAHLYWSVASLGEVMSMPLTGGTPSTIATTANGVPYDLTSDGKYVYWSYQIDGVRGVYYVPVAGGPPTLLVATSISTGPVVAHTDSGGHRDVYYADVHGTGQGVYVIAAPP